MIYAELAKIQKELKAPKNQFNAFGKYHYRSCEDILEAVKPLLGSLALVISDEVIQIGNRIYIKATVALTDGKETVLNTAWAREEEDKKGMDGSQITGAASSYARKYALNGMFLIDDNKDSDSTNEHGKGTQKASGEEKKQPPKEEPKKEPPRKPTADGDARSKLQAALEEYADGDVDLMESVLREITRFEKDGKTYSFGITNIYEQKDDGAFRISDKWIGTALGKVREMLNE